MTKKQQVENSVPWWWNGVKVDPDTISKDVVGFVYRITRWPSKQHVDIIAKGVGMVLPGSTKVYIGKKQLQSNRKQKIGKRAIAAERASRADGKAKTVKRVIKDSGWQQYNSSCKPLQKDIEEHPELFTKEILHWCWSKKNMSWWETVEQIRHSVMDGGIDSYNDHVGNWYRHDIDKQAYEDYKERQKARPKKPRIKKKVL